MTPDPYAAAIDIIEAVSRRDGSADKWLPKNDDGTMSFDGLVTAQIAGLLVDALEQIGNDPAEVVADLRRQLTAKYS